MSFNTRANGAILAEVGRFDSSGNLGVGDTSPPAPGGADARVISLKATKYPQFIYKATAAAADSTTWRTIARDTLQFQIQTVNDAINTEQTAYEIIRTTGSNSIDIQRWYTATSERMRLDNSGNLLVGTTSATSGGKIVSNGIVYQFQTDNGTTATPVVSGGYLIGPNDPAVYAGIRALNAYLSSNASQLAFYVTNTTGGAYEAGRFDPSGNLCVGTATALATASGRGNVTINGSSNSILALGNGGAIAGYVFGDANSLGFSAGSGANSRVMTFDTNGTERARIDSSGNLLVGATASGGQSGFAVLKGAGGIETSIEIAHNFGTASGVKYADFLYATGSIGSITQSGTTAVLYNLTSDQRLKENIQDAAPASALIDAIQVRQFDWKSDGSFQRYGFIAQELVTVAPEAVHAPADPEEMMAVDYSKLVPMLVKEIQSLRKRLADAGI